VKVTRSVSGCQLLEALEPRLEAALPVNGLISSFHFIHGTPRHETNMK
jgi:hypothetical protein